jgi:hypothetical protein
MRDDGQRRPPRGGRPGESRATAPDPLPAGTVTAFAAQHRMALGEIAARLGLEPDQLAAYDRTGGPGWLRLALVGVAVARGVSVGVLASLLAPAPTEPRDEPQDSGPA